jgi:hypothetical protein
MVLHKEDITFLNPEGIFDPLFELPLDYPLVPPSVHALAFRQHCDMQDSVREKPPGPHWQPLSFPIG